LLGRELTDLDFAPDGSPLPFSKHSPDCHPLLCRLLSRTFTRHVADRFPSHDIAMQDRTGINELIATLDSCTRALDAIRLEVAGWTSTGVVRSANEDALAILHSSEARLEDCDDFAIIVLSDGMGGMASGEVAASLAVQSIRSFFLKHPPIADLIINPNSHDSMPDARTVPFKPTPPGELVSQSLQEANRYIFNQGQRTLHQRGMGCTAEVLLIDGKQAWVGHVGDSRCYHLRQGKIQLVTQDHTLVSQLFALGQLTQQEALNHPNRSELQQALGGRPEVYPDIHHIKLERGDWLIICSDGLTNQLSEEDIARTVMSVESAEKASRRLINQAITAGAMDNVSVILVRTC
jgi:protein phosphatase